MVSGYEKQLSRDGPVLDFPNSLQKRNQDVQVSKEFWYFAVRFKGNTQCCKMKRNPLVFVHNKLWSPCWLICIIFKFILIYFQNLRKDVAASQPEMQKLNRDLETTEKLCSSLQQGYQEYCPDIRRQEAQVKSLQNRYANLNNQLVDRYDVATKQLLSTKWTSNCIVCDYCYYYRNKPYFTILHRESLLQGANSKNTDFQNAVQSLDMFLDNLPNNKIRPSDNISEVLSKKTSQEVGGLHLFTPWLLQQYFICPTDSVWIIRTDVH